MTLQIPKHIAIVMDGVDRWIKQQLLSGALDCYLDLQAMRQVINYCAKNKIKVLSLFAFNSTDDLSIVRQQDPSQLMHNAINFFLKSLRQETALLQERNIKLRFIGDHRHLTSTLQKEMFALEKLTQENTGMVMMIAIDYSGQWDIYQAARQLVLAIEAGNLASTDITPEKITSKLSFADLPDPDLFIRTNGELRISNIMLWQLAYTEFYFTETSWADFGEKELIKALTHYAKRERRYGTLEKLIETP